MIYEPMLLFRNGDLQTVLPTLTRRVRGVAYERERIATPDGDFLDLDWSRAGTQRGPMLAVVSHGLEGSSRSSYVLGMARALNRAGIDVLAWNYRGCGGEPNLRLRSYHSGATDDLDVVIGHAAHRYQRIVLVGFSLGGNITLKYLGEQSDGAPDSILGGIAFSVPCDLASSARRLAEPCNRIYMERFMRTLRAKAIEKSRRFGFPLTESEIRRMRTFLDFDDRFTAPVHGFRDASDYWARASSLPLLGSIRRPTLLVSALDDPFLTPSCYPTTLANPFFRLETPNHGGHTGFVEWRRDGLYWSERRALAFIESRLAAV